MELRVYYEPEATRLVTRRSEGLRKGEFYGPLLTLLSLSLTIG